MAIRLNGTTTHLRTSYTAAMAVTGNTVSLSAWIKPATLTGEIIGRHHASSTTNSLYALDIANGVLRMGIGASGFLNAISTQRASGGSLKAGQWYHVAGTYDGTSIRAYVNGAQVGSLALTADLLTSNTPLAIGAHFNGSAGSNFFSGEIEDVRKYARALSANEVLTMFNVAGRDGMVQGLRAQYPLNGSIGGTVAASVSMQDIGPFSLSTTNVASGVIYTSNIMSGRTGN